MGLEVVSEGIPIHLANLMVQSELLARIKATQFEDPKCAKIKQLLAEGKQRSFVLRRTGCSPISSKYVYQESEN
jgi:hypothetical protein